MSNCKICGLGLVKTEEESGICYSCETNPKKIPLKDNKEDFQKKDHPKTKVKTYEGKQREAAKKFEEDAKLMAKEGYTK